MRCSKRSAPSRTVGQGTDGEHGVQARNPDYAHAVRELFSRAAFVDDLGVELRAVGPGWCESALPVRQRHLQQDQLVHAGVQATLADHTAGGAAVSLASPGQTVLSVEFKINFLRPAAGELLLCRACVIKPGRTLMVAESEVHARRGALASLVSKATVTLAVVPLDEA